MRRPTSVLTALAAFIVIAIPSLAGATQAYAATEHRLVGDPFGSFNHPTGVAVDPTSSHLLVVDGGELGTGPERIAIFGLDGVAPAAGLQSEITGAGTPTGAFAFGPEQVGLAVDHSGGPANGTLYVTDTKAFVNKKPQALDRFIRNGSGEYEYASQIAGLGQPTDVVVDGHGNVYVADYGHSVVREFDDAGAEVAKFQSEARFPQPQSVAVDDSGDIYVQSYTNHNLTELKRSSPTATTVDSETELLTGGVVAIAYDRTANLLYVDRGNAVAEYDSAGNKLGEFGGGILVQSLGLAVNEATQTVYVSDAGTDHTLIFGLFEVIPPVSETPTTPVSQPVTPPVVLPVAKKAPAPSVKKHKHKKKKHAQKKKKKKKKPSKKKGKKQSTKPSKGKHPKNHKPANPQHAKR